VLLGDLSLAEESDMKTRRRARRLSALLIAAAFAIPVAQAHGQDVTPLDTTNLPCTPTCPEDLGASGTGARGGTIVLEGGGFDWGDAGIGVGAGLGIAAVIAGLGGAVGARRRHRPA
jgi:hypothetical protein